MKYLALILTFMSMVFTSCTPAVSFGKGKEHATEIQSAEIMDVESHKLHEESVRKKFISRLDIEGRYTTLPYEDQDYARYRKILKKVLKSFIGWDDASEHHLTSLYLYIFVLDEDKYRNFTVQNFDDQNTAIVVRLTSKMLKEMSDDVITFILAHELGHGFTAIKKRYYLSNDDGSFKLPRFTSEELQGNHNYGLLYTLFEDVGFNDEAKNTTILFHDSFLNHLLSGLLDRTDFSIEHREEQEISELTKLGNLLDNVTPYYNEFTGSYDVSNSNKIFSEIREQFRKVLGIYSSNISYGVYLNSVGNDPTVIQYLDKLLFGDLYLNLTIEQKRKTLLSELLFSTSEKYYQKYLKNKAYYDSIIPKIRIYSWENIADETAMKILMEMGIGTSRYIRDFLNFVLPPDESGKCINEYIKKDIEPPIGALSNSHPSPCWRMFSLKKLED